MPKQAKPEDLKKRIENMKKIESSNSSDKWKQWAALIRVKLEKKLKQ